MPKVTILLVICLGMTFDHLSYAKNNHNQSTVVQQDRPPVTLQTIPQNTFYVASGNSYVDTPAVQAQGNAINIYSLLVLHTTLNFLSSDKRAVKAYKSYLSTTTVRRHIRTNTSTDNTIKTHSNYTSSC